MGEDYQLDNDLINVAKVIDFTKESVRDEIRAKSTSEKDNSDEENQLSQMQAVDTNGHGTFIAGVIGSTHPDCPGIAPEAEIYILKLFTDDDLTYTSWFLDAFNYVLEHDIDVVNLSTASKDSQDIPFIEKIEELTANGVIIISAIGNDGPSFGSPESPGELAVALGVGSLHLNLEDVADFSARGMTTKNLLDGIGLLKPDLVAPGSSIKGLSLTTGECELKSGTSVSAAVMSGSVALVLSSMGD